MGFVTDVRRGMENEARDVTMNLIRSLRSDPLMKVGPDYSVKSAVMLVKSRLQRDKQLGNGFEHIEGNILKGQSQTPIS